MAAVPTEYGPIDGVESQAQDEPLAVEAAALGPRTGRACLLGSVGAGALLAVVALSGRGALRTSAQGLQADGLINLAATENEPFQCSWNWGEGVGSWEDVWSDEQKGWCCEHKQRGCPTKPLFDCTEGFANWQLGWSAIKKTWCCKTARKGCSENLCKEANVIGGPKLFCAAVIRTGGYEPDLMRKQLDKCVNIFACDDWIVVSDHSVFLSRTPQVTTLAFSGPHLAKIAGESKNSRQFVGFWKTIHEDGRYKQADWIVKADPDTVFFADRLKTRLESYSATESTFFANCESGSKVGPHDGRSFMYGALEVISKPGLETFLGGMASCKHDEKFEEEFLTDCMEGLGVSLTRQHDLQLLRDDHAKCGATSEGAVCTADSVAMHPFSSVDSWFKCFEQATAN